RRIVELCGRLPLAIRIAGAKLQALPHWSAAHLAELLTDERRRLDTLSHSDIEVRASLMLSYQGLSHQEQTAFRMLGVPDSATFPGWVLQPLLGSSVNAAASALDGLVLAQLVEVAGTDETGQHRFRLHDLVRDL